MSYEDSNYGIRNFMFSALFILQEELGGASADKTYMSSSFLDSVFSFGERLNSALVRENPVGRPFVRMGRIINLCKGATPLAIAALMILFSSWSLQMKLILALHGSYGLFWLLKEHLFPGLLFCYFVFRKFLCFSFFLDSSWNARVSIGGCTVIVITLFLYVSPAYFVASGISATNISETKIIVSFLLYMVGIVLMIGSDAQKNLTLEIKKGLITTGFFRLCRNPNYFVRRFLFVCLFCS
jgi:hypothetical protein